jgi:hypothetical protein
MINPKYYKYRRYAYVVLLLCLSGCIPSCSSPSDLPHIYSNKGPRQLTPLRGAQLSLLETTAPDGYETQP